MSRVRTTRYRGFRSGSSLPLRMFVLALVGFLLTAFGWHCSPILIQEERNTADAGEIPPDTQAQGICRTALDCESWEQCKVGQCIQTCTEDLDCFGGRRCSPDGICIKPIGDGGDPDETFPDTPAGECVSGNQESCYTGPQETLNKGICKGGRKTCINGRWSPCQDDITPQRESCDQLDNNCDGEIDEGCKTCQPHNLQQLAPGHLASIIHVAYDQPHQQFATSSQDQTIKIWSYTTGKLIQELANQTAIASRIAFLPDGKSLLALYNDGAIRRWDIASGKVLFATQQDQINQQILLVADKGEWFLTASYQNEVYRWSTKDLKLLQTIDVKSRIQYMALSPDEKHLAMSIGGPEMTLWDLAKGTQTAKITQATNSSTRGMIFSPDSKQLWSVDYSRVYLFDMETQKQVSSFNHNRSPVTFQAHPDGKQLVFANYNGIAIYDVATGKQNALWSSTERSITSMAISQDGAQVLYGLSTGSARSLELVTGKAVHNINKVAYLETNAVAYHPSGTHFATVEGQTTINVWERSGLQVAQSFKVTQPVVSLSFSPDGTYLYVGLYERSMTVLRAWRWAENTELFGETKRELGALNTMQISPDGKSIFTASENHTIDEWDALTGKHIRSLRGHTGPVYSLVVTPDNKQLLTASWDNTIKRWDLATGDPTAGYLGHQDELSAIAIAPDASTFVSGDRKGIIIQWDLQSGKEIRKLLGHYGRITQLQYHPTGTKILSSSIDGTLRIWSASTGTPEIALPAHKGGALSALFQPDGKSILSGGGGGTKLWNCPF